MDKGEINLLTEGGISLPVYLSISSLQTKGISECLVPCGHRPDGAEEK